MAKIQNNTNTPPTNSTTTNTPSSKAAPSQPTYTPNIKDYGELVKLLQQYKLSLKEIGVLSKSIELNLFDPKNSKQVSAFVAQLEKVKSDVDRIPKAFQNILPEKQAVNKIRAEYQIIDQLSDNIVKNSQSSSKVWIDLDILFKNANKQQQNISKSQQQTTKFAVNLNSELGDTVDIGGQISQQLQIVQGKLKQNKLLALDFSNASASTVDQIALLQKQFSKLDIQNIFVEQMNSAGSEISSVIDLLSQNLSQQTFNIGGVELNYEDALAKADVAYKQYTDKYKTYFTNAIKEIKNLSPGTTTGEIYKLAEALQKSGGDISKIDTTVWDKLTGESKILVLQLADAKKLAEQQNSVYEDQLKILKGVTSKWRSAMLGIETASGEVITELERGARNVMPTWLYSTLQVDKAFESLKSSITSAMTASTLELAKSGNKLEALSKFGAEFNMEMNKAPGILRLAFSSLGVTAGIFAGLIASAISYYKNIKAISAELGVSKAQAIELDMVSKRLVATSKNHLVTQEGVQAILKSHLGIYGRLSNISSKQFQDSVEQASELANKFGETADSMYELQQSMETLGIKKSAVNGMIKFMAEAGELSNIPFAEISKDLKANSAFVSKQFINMPNEIGKSIVKLKKMGGSLEGVAKIYDKMLDISGFTSDMTELYIMTSGAMDLTKAMELRFTPGTDPSEVMKEYLDQYDKLMASGEANPFAMDKLEKMTGKTADEFARMSMIRKMDFKTEQDRLNMQKYGMQLTDEQLKDEKTRQQIANDMAKMDQLSNQMDEVKAKIMLALLPTIKQMVAYLSSDTGRDMIASIGNGIAMVATGAGKVLGFFLDIGKSIGGWSGLLVSALAVWGSLWAMSKLISGGFSLIKKLIGGSSDSSQDLAEKIKGANTEIDVTKQLASEVNDQLTASVETTNQLTTAADATTTQMGELANSVQQVGKELTDALATAQELASVDVSKSASGGGGGGGAAGGSDVLGDLAGKALEGTPLEGLPVEDLMEAGQSVFAGTESKTDAAEPAKAKRRKTKSRSKKTPPGSTESSADSADNKTTTTKSRRRRTSRRKGKTGAKLGLGSLMSVGSSLGISNPKDMISGQVSNYGGELAGDFVAQFTDNPALQQVGDTVGEMITDKLTDRLMSPGGMKMATRVLSKAGPLAAAAAGFAALGTQAYQQIGSEALNAGSVWQDMGNFVAGTGSKFFGGLEYMLGTGVSEALGTAYKGLRSDQMENFRGAYRAMTGEQIGFSDEANEKLINWVKANEAVLKEDRGTKDAFAALQKKLESGEIKVTSTDVTKNKNWDEKIAKEKAAEEERKQKQASVKQQGFMNQPGYIGPQVKQQGYLTAETLTPKQEQARKFIADIKKQQLELTKIPAPKVAPGNYAGQDSEKEMKTIRTQPAQYAGAASAQEMSQVKAASTVVSDSRAAADAAQIKGGTAGKADPNISKLADSIAANANRPWEVKVDLDGRTIATATRQYNNK